MTYRAHIDPKCCCPGCADGHDCLEPTDLARVDRGRPAVVYRLYGTSRRLVYVGCTEQWQSRPFQQIGVKAWAAGERIAAVKFEHYATRDEAEAVEYRAIRDEDPLTNLHRGYQRLHDGWVVEPLRVERFTVSYGSDWFRTPVLVPLADEAQLDAALAPIDPLVYEQSVSFQ